MGRENKTDRLGRNLHRHEVKDRRIARKDARESAAVDKAKRAQSTAADLDDIDKALRELENERAQLKGVETQLLPVGENPKARVNASLVDHPLQKDELVMFGGAYYDGQREFVYDDLLVYNIKKCQWRRIVARTAPAPRCGHSAAVRPALGGQMFLFGGEYVSRTGANFKHYGDLWVFNFTENAWEELESNPSVSGKPPSPRSGHRMVFVQGPPPRLIIFGGFFDNARGTPRYFNDVHILDLGSYTWTELAFPTTAMVPEPRSATQMCAGFDGQSFTIFGGYSVKRVKTGADRGQIHSDVWSCSWVESDERWIWTRLRPTGNFDPTKLSGFALTHSAAADAAGGGLVIGFGGARDIETEEKVGGAFSNELFGFDFEQNRWYSIRTQQGMKTKEAQEQLELETLDLVTSEIERKRKAKRDKKAAQKRKVHGRGRHEQASSSKQERPRKANPEAIACFGRSIESVDGAWPTPRMNPALVLKGKTLYLYGGVREGEGDLQVTLGDLYTIDLANTIEWRLIFDTPVSEWQGEASVSSSSESSSNEED